MKMKRYCQKLALNLGVIGFEVALIWVAYNLFARNWLPLVAVISFFITLGGLIALLKVVNSRRFRWQRPGTLKTTIAVIMIIIVCTFAGIEPMSSHKDRIFTSITSTLEKWEEEREIQRAEEEARQEAEEQKELVKAEQGGLDETTELYASDDIFELEHAVILLVNLIRADRGTSLLVWDEELYLYSKEHSVNMARVGDLFHTDMNLPYGENAWGGSGRNWDEGDIVESWMSSPMHRTWLLCPSLEHIAVGVAISKDGDMYASWTFWRNETRDSDWWYCNDTEPPDWWH